MEEGSLRDGGAGFKVLRGGCSIFCHSLSPYVHPLLPFRAAATAALALRRVTGNYDNFEKLFSHVYATACTGSGVAATHPSVACPPPLLLVWLFSMQIVSSCTNTGSSFCGISNCNVIYEFSSLLLTLRQDCIDRYGCLRDLKRVFWNDNPGVKIFSNRTITSFPNTRVFILVLFCSFCLFYYIKDTIKNLKDDDFLC